MTKKTEKNQTFTVDATLNVAPFYIHKIDIKLLEKNKVSQVINQIESRISAGIEANQPRYGRGRPKNVSRCSNHSIKKKSSFKQ
ncbi:hypothetical protein BpHYR1_000476 [Brachionus plicatilis]|uniref:Uncharacterized protein n=1 Tax=Brachionus plicatilis TaxID=10195 RepID=A0A3M7RMJ1_BRAPC|nr:hypothetical protein BpHYR1_000476 [Brachionus plicatilis]